MPPAEALGEAAAADGGGEASIMPVKRPSPPPPAPAAGTGGSRGRATNSRNRAEDTIRGPYMKPGAIVLLALLYGVVLAYLPFFRRPAAAPLSGELAADGSRGAVAAAPPAALKPDRKWGGVNWSALKRKFKRGGGGKQEQRGKRRQPGKREVLHRYYEVDEERREALRRLTSEVDAVPGLRKRAKEVQHDIDELTMLRYLEVVNWGTPRDGSRLVDLIARNIEWREAAGVARIRHTDVHAAASSGKLYVRGQDRDGRAIIHYTPALESPPYDVEANKRLLVYTLERALREMGPHQSRFAVIVDCSHFTFGKMPPVGYIRESLAVIQQYYPMRLGYVRMVKASRGVNLVWKIISAMLSERTNSRISFLGAADMCPTLLRTAAPAALPAGTCGTDAWAFSMEEYLA